MRVRPGTQADAVTIAALATQVFLDTYATDGVRPDLAREAFHEFSEQAFAARLALPFRRFLLVEHGDAVAGFAELLCADTPSAVTGVSGAELVRLYVQPRAQRAGLGKLLISEAEALAAALSIPQMWLTVWEGNANALAFYRHMGYAEAGETTYAFQGRTYGNRVFAKKLGAAIR